MTNDYIRKLTGFEIGGPHPVDKRFVLTKKEMREEPMMMPDLYFAMCVDDSEFYIYDSENEVLDTTGRFRPLLGRIKEIIEIIAPRDCEGNYVRAAGAEETAKALEALEAYFNSEMDALEAKFDSEIGELTEALLEEVNERILGDLALEALIDSETARAIAAENELDLKIDSEVAHLGDLIEDVDDRLQKEIDRATASEGVLALLIEELTQDVEDLEVKLDSEVIVLNAKIDSEVGKLNDRLDVVDSEISRLDDELVELNSEVIILNDKVDALDSEVARIDSELVVIDNKVDMLDSEVQALDEKVDLLDSEVEALNRRVDLFDSEIDRLDGRIDDLEDKVDSEVDRLDGRVDLLDSEVSELSDKVDELEVKIDSEVERLEDLIDSEVSKLEDKIDTLEDKVDSEVSRLDDKIDSEVTRLEDLIDSEIASVRDWAEETFVKDVLLDGLSIVSEGIAKILIDNDTIKLNSEGMLSAAASSGAQAIELETSEGQIRAILYDKDGNVLDTSNFVKVYDSEALVNVLYSEGVMEFTKANGSTIEIELDFATKEFVEQLVDSERLAREAVDSELFIRIDELDSEVIRLNSEVEEVKEDIIEINSEIDNLKVVDSELETKIEELDEKVDSEVSRLEDLIDSEEAARKLADSELSKKIDDLEIEINSELDIINDRLDELEIKVDSEVARIDTLIEILDSEKQVVLVDGIATAIDVNKVDVNYDTDTLKIVNNELVVKDVKLPSLHLYGDRNTLDDIMPDGFTADSENYLADQIWVIDKLASLLGTFRGSYDSEGGIYAAYPVGTHGPSTVIANNDYSYTVEPNSEGTLLTRYKAIAEFDEATGEYTLKSWEPEYHVIIPGVPFTSAELEAIRSGITKTKVKAFEKHIETVEDVTPLDELRVLSQKLNKTGHTIEYVKMPIWLSSEGTGLVFGNKLNVASGEYAVAEGNNTKATGKYVHVEGQGTQATKDAAHAEGFRTEASGYYSHAEGNASEASGDYSHAEGDWTTASGIAAHAEGSGTASGDYSHAEGSSSKASGEGSHAEGSATASGDYSHAEGVWRTKADGKYSHAEGWSKTLKDYAHAEGKDTTASGEEAHAEGYLTIASGENAHAEGWGTTASGLSSHAEGLETKALKADSHAEGAHTIAGGSVSHAEGYNAIITSEGMYSHAEGYYTTIASAYQHVQGKYNIADSEGKFADIIGNGVDNTNRKNISALDWSGNLHLKGMVYVDADDDSTNGTMLRKIFKMTKDEYDALVSVDSEAVYLIEDSETIATISPNWSENDVTSLDYIKNRTHYTKDDGSVVPLNYKYTPGSFVDSEGKALADGAVKTVKTGEVFNDYVTNVASGDYSHAEGNSTTASGEGSHAEGHLTIASGKYAHAEGGEIAVPSFTYKTIASGAYSHAEGQATTASGEASHAEGYYNEVSGNYSHAEGMENKISGHRSHVEGTGNTVTANSAHAEGNLTTASGNCSHAEGGGTKATNYHSHAEGSQTTASGDSAHAEGNNTIASGLHSHAEGQGTSALNKQSHAEGYFSTASGEASHAEGYNSLASGNYSHAEGNQDVQYYKPGSGTVGVRGAASGSASHTEGVSTTSTNEAGHTEGIGTVVRSDNTGHITTKNEGKAAHAEGILTAITSTGQAAHAEGYGTIASSKAQHVQGISNIEDSEGKFADIVGGGVFDVDSNTIDRKNISALEWNGTLRLKGDVYVQCNDNSTGGSKLIAVPEPPATGTYTLKAVNGVLTWVAG